MGQWDDMDEAEIIFRMEHGATLSRSGPWTPLLTLIGWSMSGLSVTPLPRVFEVLTKHTSVRVVVKREDGDAFDIWNDHGESVVDLLLAAMHGENVDISNCELHFANETLAPRGPPSESPEGGFDTSGAVVRDLVELIREADAWQQVECLLGGEAFLVARVWHEDGTWILEWDSDEWLPGDEPRYREFATKALACTWATLVQKWQSHRIP